MKTKHFFVACAGAILLFATGCKKEKSGAGNDEIETTFELSEKQAISEELQDDANQVFLEAAAEKGLAGGRTASTSREASCATVTVTPGGSTFPKQITIDFGTGCSSNGITRKGIIHIALSDSVHKNGATAVMTFENYFVEDFKLEGTITWVNTSTPNGISWTREIQDGKVTAPGGNYYWLHVGSKAVQQIEGAGTPLNPLDDVYSITGSHTVTNPAGKSRTATITEPLIKPFTCHNVTKGKVKIEGPNHYAIVDFGDGTCDRTATISIDGRPQRTIILP